MKEMIGALDKLSSETVTEDFNAKLLSRIAEERFKETRAKAYLPKSAPLFGWQKIVPVVATACLVLAFVLTGGISILDNDDNGSAMVAVNNNAGDNLDDDYLTVLPNADRSYDLDSKNQAFAAHTKANWEFNKELARANRIKGYMNSLAGYSNGFTSRNSSLSSIIVNPERTTIVMLLPFGQQRLGGSTTNQIMVTGN